MPSPFSSVTLGILSPSNGIHWWLIQWTTCPAQMAIDGKEPACSMAMSRSACPAWRSAFPLGQPVPRLPLESTCQYHEDGYQGIHLEPVEPRAATTHSGAQEDGACQYQNNIQDLAPDGQPQNTCQRKGMLETLGISNSEVLKCSVLWFSSFLNKTWKTDMLEWKSQMPLCWILESWQWKGTPQGWKRQL